LKIGQHILLYIAAVGMFITYGRTVKYRNGNNKKRWVDNEEGMPFFEMCAFVFPIITPAPRNSRPRKACVNISRFYWF